MISWGSHSKKQIDTLCDDLKKILAVYERIATIDITIVQGHRMLSEQQELYKKGLSKVKLSKHNYLPSKAFDFCVYEKGNVKARYDIRKLSFVAGQLTAISECLKDEGIIKVGLRWGGNWDGDSVIITDQTFQDFCHIEVDC